MNADIDLKSIKIKPLLLSLQKKVGKHAVFGAVVVVLLVYVLIVYKIDNLANAEPGPDQQDLTTAAVPKIDQKTIDQIQLLENNNAEIHSLFEKARTNPFSE